MFVNVYANPDNYDCIFTFYVSVKKHVYVFPITKYLYRINETKKKKKKKTATVHHRIIFINCKIKFIIIMYIHDFQIIPFLPFTFFHSTPYLKSHYLKNLRNDWFEYNQSLQLIHIYSQSIYNPLSPTIN